MQNRMKPSLISNCNPNYNPQKKRNLNNTQIQTTKLPERKNVSFGASGPLGNAKNAVQKALTATFKYIDNSSFFVEFLIVDTLSLVLPRILVGLNRDKELTGKYNYKAAKEEAGREVLSGPSLNLIPMAVLALASSIKSASRMSRETIDGLGECMKQVISASTPKNLTDKKAINEQLADKIFDEAFADHFKNETKMNGYKKQFSAALIKASEEKPLSLLATTMNKKPNPYKEAKQVFSNLVREINNAGKTSPLAEGEIKVGRNSVAADHLFEDIHNYSKDVIEKFVEQGRNATNICKKTSTEFIEKLTSNRLLLKTGTGAAAFFAVGTFLLYLPRLYQQKGLSPAQESARIAAEAAAKGGANESK